ncbi:Uncharacterized protein OS=Magnetospirillum gryphiswaldense MSR-1 v2 GN=MGMSRv2_2248 PE=4 SV=1: Collar [Gemmataceae bacterium]|nr:Uncharacterized protein OS=Magnetospirillum gryphiswaldense MSR-1 v2 GN=MGMSRv2_2248 PE=4 SV=1: Collar [Gemmataceae bacterium]VTU00992.1 Uncharacterized protein OS=Magnetospirillum gryphiswaldense MSR-1 v2 GN=MGMSRv2_2248 PE=4 SV=1: Collar [Gemmataceae bacterium]
MPTTIKLRNGTAAAWTSANPTLAAGEAGVETDTKKVKVGDGSTAWNSLAYIGGTGTITALTGDVTASGTGSVAATIANDAVTYAKMQNVSATDKLLGRATAGAGDVEEIACTAAGRALLDDADATAQRTTLGLGTLATQSGTFSGTSSGTNTGDQTITLTGDVTGSGTGSFAATVANDAVTDAKLRNSAALSVIGRSANSTGDPADIAAASDGQVLRRSGTTLGFGAVDLTGANAVTGTLPVASGGTGQTTAATAINALVPTQTGHAGEYLTTDGTSVSWAAAGTVPVGSILDFGSATAPSGFLACDGAAVSRSTYSALYAVIGTTWGIGDGSTTFNLPDLRGRTSIGSGTGAGLTARTIAGLSGTENHLLTTAEMPSHTHGTNQIGFDAAGTGGAVWVAGTRNVWQPNTDATGGGAAHNNMMPYRVTNKVIKAFDAVTGPNAVTVDKLNLLVNGDFRRMPQQARATLTGYATAAASTAADQFATNWGLQHNATGSTVQMRNWSAGDSSPPASFDVLGPSYLQLKNNDASARGIMIYQYVEANGPDGLAAVAYRLRQVAASIRAVASTGTPTLKCTVIEWTGTADAPARPVASWVGNVPSLAAGWGALSGYVGSASAVLNTSTAAQADISGTPTAACNGLMLCVWVEGLSAGASLYLSSAWLGLGGISPAVWAPHPGDEELCLRYAVKMGGDALYENIGFGVQNTSTNDLIQVKFPVPMRAAPSVSASAAGDFVSFNQTAGAVTTVTSIAATANQVSTQMASLTVGYATRGSTGAVTFMTTNNTLSARLTFSARINPT